ncbi:MAG: hypothetical protein WB681_08415 [Candidatus Cybelea sp.]
MSNGTTGDLVANTSNPGTRYEPTETGGVYHEDREVTTTVGTSPVSQMFRVYNAKFDFNTSLWTIQSSGKAYATVQNPDGSIHYLTNPNKTSWFTTEWVGSDDNTIYNGVDFGMIPTSVNPTFDNGPALQSVISAIVKTGGRIQIPSGKYNFNTGISHSALNVEDVGIIIEGLGGGAELQASSTFTGSLITFSNFSTTGNGIRFRNLRISYLNDTATGPAVSLFVCQNVSFDQVFFDGCPGALVDDNRSGQCGMTDCTIQYNINNNDQIMVTINGAQDYIHNCVIRQQTLNKGGPTGCTAILIGPASEPYVTNTHISDFDTGIKIVGGSNLVRARISNVECDSNVTSVMIVPAANSTVQQVFFDNCIFKLSADSPSVSPGVSINANGNNALVTDIHFNHCMFHAWLGAGILIEGGQDIVIDGCRVGSCALELSLQHGGGISITGTAANVMINASDCSGSVIGDSGQQPYAISVTAAVEGLYVRGCILTGNATAPLFVSASGAQMEITDCAGYNDERSTLTTTAPGSNVVFSATTYGYYGPVAFYVSGGVGTSVKIDNNATGLTAGGFTLGPGENAAISYTTAPSFVMVGK